MTTVPRLRRSRLCAVVWAVAALAAAQPALAEQPLPNSPDPSTWTTDGTVQALATLDGVTYLGGTFNYVGPSTGSAVIVTPGSGALTGSPGVAGTIADAEPDGSGGVYLAGSFNAAGGLARSDLLHLLADGSVDPAFDPGPFTNTALFGSVEVRTLLLDGGRLYVGGTFTSIDGLARESLAALDPADGSVLSFDPSITTSTGDPGTVRALVPATADDSVYAGGTFDRAGGLARPNLVHLRADGAVLATFSGNEPSSTVHALRLADARLYVGGSFSRLGASVGGFLRRYSPPGTVDAAWIPAPSSTVNALDVVDGGATVYAAGPFATIGAGSPVSRAGVGAVRVADARATVWDPAPSGTISGIGSAAVNALRIVGGTVYLGGNFTSAGGEARDAFAAVDLVGGDAQPFSFGVGGLVQTIEPTTGGKVVIAGSFRSVQGVRRRNLAAFGSDGTATAWNPRADGSVRGLAIRGSQIFAGGDFDVIGGAPRNGLARLSTASDVADPFDPAPDGLVRALALAPGGGTLYVGGDFTRVGTPPQTRPRLAALDPDTGAASAWQPQPDGFVDGLAPTADGGTLYVSGAFANVGVPPAARRGAAAVSTASGQPTPFSLTPTGGGIFTLFPSGGDVYVGGTFTQLSGQTRRGIAAVGSDGALRSFDPAAGVNASVFDFERTAGGTMLLAGTFLGLGVTDRRLLAEVDALTGAPTAWNPRLSSSTSELLVDGRNLWVGAQPGATDLRSSGGLLRFVRPADPAGPLPPGPGPGGPADTTPPALTRLALARATFAVGSRATAQLAARRRRSGRRAPRGTTIAFTLSETATVRVAIQRSLPGRRSRGRCRRPSARLRARPRCTRFTAAGALTRANLSAGRQAIPFSGRVGRRALAPGTYRFVLTAADATGNRSPPRTIAFRIVRAG